MAKWEVRFAQVRWLTVHNVEADTEEDALDYAYDELPAETAMETGWGSMGRWTADYDEWYPMDEFINTWSDETRYNERLHGLVVEPS